LANGSFAAISFPVRQFYEPDVHVVRVVVVVDGLGPLLLYLAAVLRSSRQEFDLGHQVKASQSDVIHVQHPEPLLLSRYIGHRQVDS
jgi:hypothetical protein